MKLDGKDLLVLYYLRNNSRISLSELGKELKLTPSGVSYRLSKLIENNVIHKFTIEVNNEIVTPNYTRYLITINIKSNLIGQFKVHLTNSNYIDKLYEIASSNNLVGVSYPLSPKQFKKLISLLGDHNIEFNVTPVVKSINMTSSALTGEDIEKVYCPLCQKEFDGEGIVTSILDKTFSFCCEDCQIEFKEEYSKLIKD